MPSTPPIAHIKLARSIPRLLLVPVVVVGAGIAAIVAGILLATGVATIALAALGALVALGGVAGGVLLLSVGFEVAESAVSMTWLGGRLVYPLAPGPVTRVRLRGPNASALRPRSGAVGWGIGPARLRDEEEIDLIRLTATRTAILIPTEHRRLAVAPDRDDELLEALARAAQARQRLEAEAEAAASPPPAEPEPELGVQPTPLTGIERALLEERLARERDEAEAARIAAAAAAESEAVSTGASLNLPAPVPAAPAEVRRPRRSLRLPRPQASWAFVLLPSVGAAVAWWAGRSLGVLPAAGSDLARLTSLALVLAGPATSVAALMALAWWPRLVGVVVAGGLVAAVFIGRVLIG
jgi:hypothetical protein